MLFFVLRIYRGLRIAVKIAAQLHTADDCGTTAAGWLLVDEKCCLLPAACPAALSLLLAASWTKNVTAACLSIKKMRGFRHDKWRYSIRVCVNIELEKKHAQQQLVLEERGA